MLRQPLSFRWQSKQVRACGKILVFVMKRERDSMLSVIVLEDSWCAAVKTESAKTNSKVLFLSERLFMNLTLEKIAKLLPKMNDRWAAFEW